MEDVKITLKLAEAQDELTYEIAAREKAELAHRDAEQRTREVAAQRDELAEEAERMRYERNFLTVRADELSDERDKWQQIAVDSDEAADELKDQRDEAIKRGDTWKSQCANEAEVTAERDALVGQVAALCDVMPDLIRLAENDNCSHQSTYRGGVLWEICDQCGAKWADDEGGKPPYVEPPAIVAASRAIENTAKAAKRHDDAIRADERERCCGVVVRECADRLMGREDLGKLTAKIRALGEKGGDQKVYMPIAYKVNGKEVMRTHEDGSTGIGGE